MPTQRLTQEMYELTVITSEGVTAANNSYNWLLPMLVNLFCDNKPVSNYQKWTILGTSFMLMPKMLINGYDANTNELMPNCAKGGQRWGFKEDYVFFIQSDDQNNVYLWMMGETKPTL